MQLGPWQQQLFEAGTDYSDLCLVFDFLRQQFKADTYTVVLSEKQPSALSNFVSWSSTLSADDMAFYSKHISDDVLLKAYMQRGLVGQACIADQLLKFDEIEDPGFREYLLPYFRFRYSLSILTSFDLQQDFVITLHRHFGAQPFTEQDRQLLQQVADSLMAWTIHFRQLSFLQRDKMLLLEQLERDKQAKAVIDRFAELYYLNSAMESLLAVSPVLQQQGKRLLLAPPYQHLLLQQLSQQQCGSMILALYPEYKVVLEWSPSTVQAACFELRIVDPQRQFNLQFLPLKQLYDVTEAELEVAQLLCKGLNGAEIASCRQVSRETSKSQIRSLLRKTGCSNQNELLGLLFSFSV